MQFDTIADFFAMGGHGFYVWLSYGVSLTLLGVLALTSIHRNKNILRKIAKRHQRNSKLRQAAKSMHQETEI